MSNEEIQQLRNELEYLTGRNEGLKYVLVEIISQLTKDHTITRASVSKILDHLSNEKFVGEKPFDKGFAHTAIKTRKMLYDRMRQPKK